MYYEEKILNGVLCWRGTPNGDWTEKTAKQLTDMLVEARLKNMATPAIFPSCPQPHYIVQPAPQYTPPPSYDPYRVTC